MAKTLKEGERTYTNEIIQVVKQVPADEQLHLLWMLKGVVLANESRIGRNSN